MHIEQTMGRNTTWEGIIFNTLSVHVVRHSFYFSVMCFIKEFPFFSAGLGGLFRCKWGFQIGNTRRPSRKAYFRSLQLSFVTCWWKNSESSALTNFYAFFCLQIVGQNPMSGQVVRRFFLVWWTSSTPCAEAISFVHRKLWVEFLHCIIGWCCGLFVNFVRFRRTCEVWIHSLSLCCNCISFWANEKDEINPSLVFYLQWNSKQQCLVKNSYSRSPIG